MAGALRVLAVWAAGLGAAAQFAKVSFAWPQVAAAYAGASPVALGLIVSVVGLVGLVFGTTAGMIVGRVGPRRALLWGLGLGAAASVLQAGLPLYPVMVGLRVAEGLSHLAIVVVGPALIAAGASPRRLGLVMALWSTFFGLTYAVLALLAPPVLAAGGVAALFLAHAGWMAGCALLLARLLPPDPPPDPPPVAPGAGRGRGLLAALVTIYADPWVAAPALGFVCYTASFVALLTLLPPLMPAGLGPVVATAVPLVSIAASLTLGVWMQRWLTAMQVVGCGYGIAAAGTAVLAAGLGAGGAMLAGALIQAAGFGLVQGACFAAIPALNRDTAARARAAGAVAQLGNLGTVSGTPILAALLAALGPAAVPAMILPLCLCGLALVAWTARRRARRDAPPAA